MQTNEELQQQIEELKLRLDSLTNYNTIPREISDAFKAKIIGGSNVIGSSNSTSIQTTTVNESGSATYTVAKIMTGFITITIDGIDYAIPYY